MIFFYKKDDGKIFAVVDGRVHTEQQLNVTISDSTIDESNIDKYVIGWVEKDGEIKEEHNLDKFELLQEFESTSDVSPLQYSIKDGSFSKDI